jgi:23S rRNA pseudouridine955/2504/2580 synthase
VDENQDGQRIDNFLVKYLKGVPKSHLYRILRQGEVRVNSRRVDAAYRLKTGDKVRIPPIRASVPVESRLHPVPVAPTLSRHILYQDDALLVLNKPAGMAVHGGSGISRGVIEQLRLEFPGLRFLELAHRLDRETSGVLVLAKKRGALVALHRAMREGEVEKRYLTLVKGDWKTPRQSVRLPLHKHVTREGERRVNVDEKGQYAHTVFTLKQSWGSFSLLEAELKTGRTHQIRVHLAHLGFPIAGDDKYGDFSLNRELHRRGLKRMFLHAYKLTLKHPVTGQTLCLEAPLPAELEDFLHRIGEAREGGAI